MKHYSVSNQSVDLTNCDLEPIHTPGSIQPHGALITLDPQDMRVVHAGGDTARSLGLPPDALLGLPAADILAPEHVRQVQRLLEGHRSLLRPVHSFTMLDTAKAATDAFVHRIDGLLVLEFEPRRTAMTDNAVALVQGMVRHVQLAGCLQELLEMIAKEVHAVSQFDRVMVYRFSPDDSGEVVAEARDPEVDSFIGHNFPAGDIPRQARQLYLRNWIRYIPDARYEPLPVVPPLNPFNGKLLDLSHSVLRSVSTVHRQYLANMGVVASMSLSLVAGTRLWGLVACHNGTPHYLSHRLRDACGLFAEMASAQLEKKLAEIDLQAQRQAGQVQADLLAHFDQETDFAQGLLRQRPNLLDCVRADGAVVWIQGQFSAIGRTPTPQQVEGLVTWLNAHDKDGIFHTDYLSAQYKPAQAFADVASGLLALSVSRTPRDYLLWFRPEVSKVVTWAGNPTKHQEACPDGERLTPRHSFAAWRESVRLHADAWLPAEVEAAGRLRVLLLEVVLRRIDQIAREREVARRHQEELARESDQRLEEWRVTAEALRQETDRRAVLEAELSQVLRRIVADQENERLRIARELHDTLGQSVTLLQLGLESLADTPPSGEGSRERLAGLKSLAVELGRDLNRLAWEVRPTALDDLGIETAIRNLLETWSDRSAIPFDLHISLANRRLSAEIETTLYRVLQEALTNVVRHAEATRVGVVLSATDQLVTMIIEDDGHGFFVDAADPCNLPPKRLGLLGIRERVALVAGSLEVESLLDHGTTLFVRVPLGTP